MTWTKSTIFLIIILALAFPTVQKVSNLFKSRGLEGYFQPSPRPLFSLAAVTSGEYQAKMTPHMDRTIGFHNNFTRLFNQFDFTLFSIPHASRMIVGENNYIQADSHIDAFLGNDFAGKKYIDDKVARLKYLQDYFLTKKGVTLLVIMAPGKGFYYPETIPDRFMKLKKGLTNNDYYCSQMQKNGINLIDFNQWLISMKDTSRHILYPKTGIHWSCYGAWLCADSLIRYLEVRLNRALPHMVLDSLVYEPVARRKDNDLDRVLNLMWRIPVPVMTYPVFHHEYNDSLPKPPALFISDSFYWYWHDNRIIKNTFKQVEMWYYDKEVYPMQLIRQTSTAYVDLDQAISRQKVVILMQTNAGYGNLGYGFVDRAYEYYYAGNTPVKRIIENFRSSPGMMAMLEEKAREQNLPVEAVALTDAIFLYNNELKRISKYN